MPGIPWWPGSPPMARTSYSTLNEPGLNSTVSPGLISKPPLDRSHLRDAVLHLHLVNLESGSGVRGAADQPIGHGTSIFDRHIAGSNARPFRSGARPRVGNLQRARLVVAGMGRGESQAEETGKEKSEEAHCQ